MSDRDRDALAAARVRAACRLVARDLGFKVVADLWGCDESTVGLKLDERNRNYVRPSEMLALKRADLHGVIKAAEDAELERPVSAEDVVRRLPGALRKYLAEELAEVVEREVGLR